MFAAKKDRGSPVQPGVEAADCLDNKIAIVALTQFVIRCGNGIEHCLGFSCGSRFILGHAPPYVALVVALGFIRAISGFTELARRHHAYGARTDYSMDHQDLAPPKASSD